MNQSTRSANVLNVSVLYLVRHGQASFGTEDYDRLSPRGKDQSQSLGTFLMRAGTTPTSITSGGMKRQRQTAQGLIEAADWDTQLDIDPGWDEFNATDLISAYPTDDPSAKSDSRAFQRLLEKASTRWASGDHDADYLESFTAFTDRVDAALDRAVDRTRVRTERGRRLELRRHRLGGGPAAGRRLPAMARTEPGHREFRRHQDRLRRLREDDGDVQRPRPSARFLDHLPLNGARPGKHQLHTQDRKQVSS